MSALTGLDPLEAAVVATCDALDAGPDRPHHKCARVLTEVEKTYGYGLLRSYDALLDLARPWVRWRVLIDVHGNFGSPEHDAAESRYTECRLTRAGELAVAAERRDSPALPLGLVEGTFYRGGSVAPADPGRVGAAIRAVVESPATSDGHLREVLGPPAFPTGCDVTVDDGAMRLSAKVTLHDDAIELTGFPPGGGPSRAIQGIVSRARHLPIRDVNDVSSGFDDRVRCELRRGADVEAVAAELTEIWGVHVVIRAQPLDVGAVRAWVDEHWDHDRSAVVMRQLAMDRS